MEKQKFEAVLTLLGPQVIRVITEHYPYDEGPASREFSESEVYSSLEQEDTKVWHLSPLHCSTCLMKKRKPVHLHFQRRCDYE